jgi:uncharacterized protein YjeT (DUF2065 family)
MQLAIKFIGVIIIVLAFAFMLRADLLRELIRFISRGSRVYIIGAVRIAFAVILFIGATQCRRQWIIITIGIVFLLSGITIVTLKPTTLRKLFTWYQQRSDLFLRLLAVVGIVIGGLIVYAA